MAHDDRGILSERSHKLDKIGRHTKDAVALHIGRTVTLTKAAEIRRYDAKAGGGKRTDLPSPPKPKVGNTVNQKDQRALAFYNIVNYSAVDLRNVMSKTLWIVCAGRW